MTTPIDTYCCTDASPVYNPVKSPNVSVFQYETNQVVDTTRDGSIWAKMGSGNVRLGTTSSYYAVSAYAPVKMLHTGHDYVCGAMPIGTNDVICTGVKTISGVKRQYVNRLTFGTRVPVWETTKLYSPYFSVVEFSTSIDGYTYLKGADTSGGSSYWHGYDPDGAACSVPSQLTGNGHLYADKNTNQMVYVSESGSDITVFTGPDTVTQTYTMASGWHVHNNMTGFTSRDYHFNWLAIDSSGNVWAHAVSSGTYKMTYNGSPVGSATGSSGIGFCVLSSGSLLYIDNTTTTATERNTSFSVTASYSNALFLGPRIWRDSGDRVYSYPSVFGGGISLSDSSNYPGQTSGALPSEYFLGFGNQCIAKDGCIYTSGPTYQP